MVEQSGRVSSEGYTPCGGEQSPDITAQPHEYQE